MHVEKEKMKKGTCISGYGFSPDGSNFCMSPALLYLLKKADYEDIHIAALGLNNSADTQQWANFHKNQEIMLIQAKHLIMEWNKPVRPHDGRGGPCWIRVRTISSSCASLSLNASCHHVAPASM